MHLAALEAAGVTAAASLGLSLGEYAHLVHIGALDVAAAVRLVAARGALYEAGPPGRWPASSPCPRTSWPRPCAASTAPRAWKSST